MKRARKKVRKSLFGRTKSTNKTAASPVKTVLLSLLLIIVLFVASFGGYTYFQLKNSLTGYEGIDETVPIDKKSGKVTFLLVGIDKVARSTDTIMIACYDFNNNKVDVLSVPRDTRMYIGNKYFKINSAYAIKSKDGINGTIEAVTRLTGIPINRYVEFELSSFRDTIDALGGVYFDVPRNMYHNDPEQKLHINLKKGYQLLDGNKAEQLIRFRGYPMGDIDRMKVQQDFLKAVASQKLNLEIVNKVPEIFDVIKKDIKTDITAEEILQYSLSLPDLDASNVNMHSLPGYPNDQDYGASYWIADMAETKKLVEEVFGYDASSATIHSKDGKSVSKDVKLTPKTTPKPTETKEPESTVKPTNSPSATKKPTATTTPKPTKTPAATKEPTKTPVKTPKPAESPSSGGIKRPSAN